MAGNVIAFKNQILEDTRAMDPSGRTTQFYQNAFDKMSEEQIEEFAKRMIRGEETVVVYRENGKKSPISRSDKFKLAKSWGLNIFERVWVDDRVNPVYLSKPRPILYCPTRRQAQILDDKKSLPVTSNVIDELTGQAAGDSKGSSLSNPELQVMMGFNLDMCVVELMKLRGGDITAFRAMNKSIDQTGGASIEALMKLGSDAESTATLRSYLLGMHLNTTL